MMMIGKTTMRSLQIKPAAVVAAIEIKTAVPYTFFLPNSSDSFPPRIFPIMPQADEATMYSLLPAPYSRVGLLTAMKEKGT